MDYTVVVEGCTPDTPITIADREQRTGELVGHVVGWRKATWYALAPAETVTGAAPGTAAEVAEETLTNQTVADPGDGPIRVRVWEGADADTGTDPAAELIVGDEPTPEDA